jgi:hypothetical protein
VRTSTEKEMNLLHWFVDNLLPLPANMKPLVDDRPDMRCAENYIYSEMR